MAKKYLFQYKKLPDFCFHCGIIGHHFREFLNREDDSGIGELENMRYGNWLQSGIYGGMIGNRVGSNSEGKESNSGASVQHGKARDSFSGSSTELGKCLFSSMLSNSLKIRDEERGKQVLMQENQMRLGVKRLLL